MVRRALVAVALGLVLNLASACDVGGDGAEQDGMSEAGVAPALPDADGDVLSFASIGTTLYVAGEFTKLGKQLGQFAVIGQEDIPKVLGGAVETVEPDGRGGWFVGGDFETVGGERCPRLARIRADGTLDRDWCVSPDSSVYELTLVGSRLYVGGRFRLVAGEKRSAIAAFDSGSAKLLAWGARFGATGCESQNEFWVSQIDVASSSVFIGGCFLEVMGKQREGIAALNAATGQLTAWQPRIATGPLYAPSGEKDIPPSIGAWDLHAGSGALFAITARGIAELDAATGRAARWLPAPEGDVSVVAASSSAIYMGGDFDRVDGKPRRNLAAVDIQSGAVTAWRPDANASIDVLVPDGKRVFVAGVALQRVGGASRAGVAAVDSSTGRATGWKPGVTGSWVEDIGLSEAGLVGIGFYEGGVRGIERDGLAAIDTETGRITRWAPRIDGRVEALAASGTTLYLGGSFSSIGGTRRDGLAAIDATTGQVLPWNPTTGGGWGWIEARDRVVYAARRFDGAGSYNGMLVAVDEASGRVLWNARLGDPDDLAAAPVGETVFVTRAPDYSEFLTAFDATDGGLAKLGFSAPTTVTALLAHDGMLYVGMYVGMQRALRSIDPSSGSEHWRAPVDSSVQVMTASGEDLYLGGFFEHVSGQPRKNLAAVHVETGAVRDWHPTIAGDVDDIHALHVVGSTLYVGGDFEGGNLAAFPTARS